HFFDFGVGSHHGRRAPERNREHSIEDQVSALNVGFMERLHFFDFAVGAHHAGLAPEGNREHSIGHQVSALNVGFMEHLHLDGQCPMSQVFDVFAAAEGVAGFDQAADIVVAVARFSA
ncbi:hypothetical protein, partial [Pseudomonas putida]|uniref:hypothetical protein n=1 Tax=Pseudomonas putida TaxID=303 RepID=UPI0039DFD3D5